MDLSGGRVTTGVSHVRFGAAGQVPAGYARCPAGTRLLRGHSPDRLPGWFSPAVGLPGRHRFDVPFRTNESVVATCYFAETLEGVLLERVLRETDLPILSVQTLRTYHAVSHAQLTRDLILIDLCVTLNSVHKLQIADVAGPPPYDRTQQLVLQWMQQRAHPLTVDGIVYGSRFGPLVTCIALWHHSADALTWSKTERLGDDQAALSQACQRLGIGLID